VRLIKAEADVKRAREETEAARRDHQAHLALCSAATQAHGTDPDLSPLPLPVPPLSLAHPCDAIVLPLRRGHYFDAWALTYRTLLPRAPPLPTHINPLETLKERRMADLQEQLANVQVPPMYPLTAPGSPWQPCLLCCLLPQGLASSPLPGPP